ncbi:hypothetical protein CGCF413_v012109 [Colletotrichum fructicola]|nr:hypothetical protein CGCF413_v012109 [Colletotrichum fructicola]
MSMHPARLSTGIPSLGVFPSLDDVNSSFFTFFRLGSQIDRRGTRPSRPVLTCASLCDDAIPKESPSRSPGPPTAAALPSLYSELDVPNGFF